MKNRIIMLIDMDAFFAQIEQRDHPFLKGKPVLVLGGPGRHAIVTAASYEAKKYGVKSGMPLFEARKLCPTAQTIIGDHEKYLRTSYEILKIYEEFTDLIEPYSIDEAFLDLTAVQGLFGDPLAIAQEIKKRIKNQLNLTCSVGIGPNKILAKMACEFNKPDGLTVIRAEDVPDIIWPLEVSKLFGVGPKTAMRLVKLGINTIGDLARTPKALLKEELGRYGEKIHEWAWGVDFSPVSPPQDDETQSISHSYTLPYDTSALSLIKWYLYWLSNKISLRLYEMNLRARTIQLIVRFKDFTTASVQKTLATNTDNPAEIARVAYELFTRKFAKHEVRLLGIRVSNFSPVDGQLELFNNASKLRTIFKTASKLNEKYQCELLEPGVLMLENKKVRIRKKIGCFLTRAQKQLGRGKEYSPNDSSSKNE